MIQKILLLIIASCAMAFPATAQEVMRTDFRQNTDAAMTSGIFRQSANGPRRAMSTVLPNGLGQYGESGLGPVPSIGDITIPVILVAFADLDFLPTSTMEKISRWLNEEGYHDESMAAGSVADYFRFNSYGLFRPKFEVTCKVTLSGGYKAYGNKSGKTSSGIKEALALATEQGIDFSKYATNGTSPIISIVHAGPGAQEDMGDDYADYVWAHFNSASFSTSNVRFNSYIIMNEALRDIDNSGNVTNTELTGVGTFCHEFCHALGLPDIYDVNGSTSGTGQTPGFWDVMDYQFMYNGYAPMELTAYERCCLGWLELTDLPQDVKDVYELRPLDDTSESAIPRAYRIVNPANEKEYFILENHRQAPWYSSYYLGEGMLVWHVDYNSSVWAGNRVNTQAAHQYVSFVPADGTWQYVQKILDKTSYPGDLFPGKQNVTTFDKTLDNYFTGDFDLQITDIAETAEGNITFVVNPANGDATSLEQVPALSVDSDFYDLQGRKYSAGSTSIPAGIYIHKGRKTVIH